MELDQINTDIRKNKANILQIAKQIPLKILPSLQICYQVAKNNHDVIVGCYKRGAEEETEAKRQKEIAEAPLDSIMLLLPSFIQERNDAVTTSEKIAASMKLFNHAVKFRKHTNYDVKQQEVSPYLDVKVTKEHQRLLNPTMLDSITGYIIKDIQGEVQIETATETSKHGECYPATSSKIIRQYINCQSIQ